MTDPVAFAEARLDEEEAAARLAAREGGSWKQDDPDRQPGAISSLGGPVVYDEGSPDEYQAAHIARYDPARALREVEAGRRILARHRDCGFGDLAGRYCGVHSWNGAAGCRDFRDLLFRWADHPDYDESWKP